MTDRALVPIEQVNELVVLKPSSCRRCGERLVGEDAEPIRHQVWELPEIKPVITAYQRQRLIGECCGTWTCAPLPAGVPEHQSGPRLTACVALLRAHFRQSQRRLGLFCESVLSIPGSAGLAVKLPQRATAALRPADDELARALPAQDVPGIDESPTQQQNRKAWLWTFVAEEFTLFRLRESRHTDIFDELLSRHGPRGRKAFGGVVTCDRAKLYFRRPQMLLPPCARLTPVSRARLLVLGASQTGLSVLGGQRCSGGPRPRQKTSRPDAAVVSPRDPLPRRPARPAADRSESNKAGPRQRPPPRRPEIVARTNPPRRGAAAAARPEVPSSENVRPLPGTAASPQLVVDVPRPRQRRTGQQRVRAPCVAVRDRPRPSSLPDRSAASVASAANSPSARRVRPAAVS